MPADWQRVEVAGKPADVFEPDAPARRAALLYLHDLAGESPAGWPAFTALLRRFGLACVAPLTGPSWWVDRVCPAFDPELTPEHHVLRNVVPWAEARWGLGPRGLAVAGVGMGGQGAVRLGLKYPDRFPVVASLDGAFDVHELHGRGTVLDEMYDSRERCRQDTAVLQVQPFDWPPHLWFACDPASEWHRGNDRLHEKLAALGVPHTAELDAPADADRMLGFVAAALERESRRLV